ncbi:MAG: hypothetical protein JXR70_01745 [Spirochaetales bacterium]|nr:hypothetical protein [Spirochaetales bacterium]
MENDILMSMDDLFDRYFHEALAIRAICDDKDFPAEYSPVFVSIHVRGIEYFQNLDNSDNGYEAVFKFFDPEVTKRITSELDNIESSEAKNIVSNICLGGEIEQLDQHLAETEGVANFLSDMIDNQKKLYMVEEFRSHMLALYRFFIKPNIASYTEEKIKAAFQRGRINDAIKRHRKAFENDQEQDIA